MSGSEIDYAMSVIHEDDEAVKEGMMLEKPIINEEDLQVLEAQIPKADWWTVDPPWGEGNWVIEGSNDPHAGKRICDCSFIDEDPGPDGQERSGAEVAHLIARFPRWTRRLIKLLRRSWAQESAAKEGLEAHILKLAAAQAEVERLQSRLECEHGVSESRRLEVVAARGEVERLRTAADHLVRATKTFHGCDGSQRYVEEGFTEIRKAVIAALAAPTETPEVAAEPPQPLTTAERLSRLDEFHRQSEQSNLVIGGAPQPAGERDFEGEAREIAERKMAAGFETWRAESDGRVVFGTDIFGDDEGWSLHGMKGECVSALAASLRRGHTCDDV